MSYNTAHETILCQCRQERLDPIIKSKKERLAAVNYLCNVTYEIGCRVTNLICTTMFKLKSYQDIHYLSLDYLNSLY